MSAGPLSLPRAEAVTRALVEPPASVVAAEELESLAQALVGELVGATCGLEGLGRLVLGVYEVSAGREAFSRSPFSRDVFVLAPHKCRRAIGLAAVERCVRGRSATPLEAVSEVLSCSEEEVSCAALSPGAPRPPWWAEWYTTLRPPARAVVQAEAVTYATQVWSSVCWEAMSRLPTFGVRDVWWDCARRRELALRGRFEVRAWAGDLPSMLVVGSGFPRRGWRAELAFPALVSSLASAGRVVPVRVVGLWPSSGSLRVCDVDVQALTLAAEAVVGAARSYADALRSGRRSERLAAFSRSSARRGHSRTASAASSSSSWGTGVSSTTG